MMKALIGLIAQDESVTFTMSRLKDGQVRLVLKGAVNRELSKEASEQAKKLHAVLERPVVVVASEAELSEASLDDFLGRIAEQRGSVRDALKEALDGYGDAAKEAVADKGVAKAKSSDAAPAPAKAQTEASGASADGNSLFEGVGA